MKRLVAGLVLVVAAGVRGHADDRPAPAPPVSGTQPGDVPPPPLKLDRGTRLRLFFPDGHQGMVAGRLKDADGTSVTVDTGGGRSERFSRDRLLNIEYRTGGRDRKKGAAIGAAITGLAGIVACAVAVKDELQKSEGNGQVGMLFGFCGLAGAIPGGAIGFAIGTTGGHRAGVKPHGFALQLRVRR